MCIAFGDFHGIMTKDSRNVTSEAALRTPQPFAQCLRTRQLTQTLKFNIPKLPPKRRIFSCRVYEHPRTDLQITDTAQCHYSQEFSRAKLPRSKMRPQPSRHYACDYQQVRYWKTGERRFKGCAALRGSTKRLLHQED